MKILVVKLSSLGDIAHALPAVAMLKARTGAAMDWVTQPEYVELARACEGIRNVYAFPRRHFWRDAAEYWRTVRAEEYDLVVDLQGLMKSAVAGRMARAKWRTGPAWAREGAGWLYDAKDSAPEGPRRHACEELLDLVDTVAPSPEGGGPDAWPRGQVMPLHFPEPPKEEGKMVALTPFSRWATKDWPAERFAEVGRRLAAECGCRIRILGGPGDREKGTQLAEAIGAAAENLCGKTTLPELMGHLKAADLVVGVDSGPLHWADAMGVPLVAVYGATDPVRTGPWHQPDSVVTCDACKRRPCHSRTCAEGGLACLNGLAAETVCRAAAARLSGAQGQDS